MSLKWVCESTIPRDERRGPLNTSVSRKTARSDDISVLRRVSVALGRRRYTKCFFVKDLCSCSLIVSKIECSYAGAMTAINAFA